ncbi:MAG: hypothetical protein ACRDT4_21780 [Micromonosporaceae bacterium]
MNDKQFDDDVAERHTVENFSRDEATSAGQATSWPRRNAYGRIVTYRHLLEAVVVLLVVGIVAVAAVDAISTWVGFGELLQTSGWLAGVMVFWLYVEEFRAWKGARSRVPVAIVAGLVALALGAAIGFLLHAAPVPPLVSGVVGAAVAAFTYAPLWFYGIRRYADLEDA